MVRDAKVGTGMFGAGMVIVSRVRFVLDDVLGMWVMTANFFRFLAVIREKRQTKKNPVHVSHGKSTVQDPGNGQMQ